MSSISLTPTLVDTLDVADSRFDAVVLVTDKLERLSGSTSVFKTVLSQHGEISDLESLCVLHCEALPSKRLIWSPTGPVNRDYDDVRRWGEAAEKGVKKAADLGCRKPLLVTVHDSFPQSFRVSVLGALHGLYVPIEIREDIPEKAKKAELLGVWVNNMIDAACELRIIQALEEGRVVTRDIGGSDPERMSAPNVVEYIKEVFNGPDSGVHITVEEDVSQLEKSYPLLGAVNRATRTLKRHSARLILLEYTGSGSIEENIFLVGKGITYDTGGHDIKAGGHMAGMHRDKCGAAAVAGFFKVLSILKPKGIRVMGSMSMVRNSVGPDGYVADEIVTSRAKVRVRVGNTDAEGRMVMADLLCYMKEQALKVKNPQVFTIATLTGHVVLAMGPAYTAIMDNGPAKKKKISQELQAAGDLMGDPFEISNIRREDYEFHKGKSEYEDVLQCNNSPSSQTPRGHQSPSAFLIMASGMDKHGIDSTNPIPYSHIDVAGSSGPFPGVPTGSPVLSLSYHYILQRL